MRIYAIIVSACVLAIQSAQGQIITKVPSGIGPTPVTPPSAPGQVPVSQGNSPTTAPFTSISGCTLTSAGLLTCPASSPVNPQTSTYQVLASDFSGGKTITVASGTFTITLVASGAQPANGQYIEIINYGSGVVTIARSGQNINGGTASLTLAAASATAPTSALITSDSANYFASLGGSSSAAIHTLGFTLSGPIATGQQILGQFGNFPCALTGWSLIASGSGSISIDLDAVANSAPPVAPAVPNTGANKISASAPLVLSSAATASGGASAVSTWTTSRAAWDSFAINVTSVSGITFVTGTIWCQ